MNTELAIQYTDQQLQEAEKKASGWQVFGKKAALNEISIAHKVGITLNNYALPSNIEDIQAYEIQLADLKILLQQTKEEREKDTKITDAWKERRMLPEKQVKDFIANYSDALLELKKKSESDRALKQARQTALTNFRSLAMQEYNELQSTCAKIVTDKVIELFVRALESENTTAITGDIMKAMKSALTEKSFALPVMQEPDADKLAILTECFAGHSPSYFVSAYHIALEEKFADFANAKKFKTEALAQAKYEQANATEQINELKQHRDIAANMVADSTAEIELAHKALKEVYVINMPDNAATMMAIDRAFISVDGYSKITRVKSCWSIKQEQKGALLAKMKSDDNNLQLQGITFSKEHKL